MRTLERIYSDDENFIVISECKTGIELVCVYGDKVFYYVPNRLLDMVLFSKLMERMNISEDEQNEIRNTVGDKFDSWKRKRLNFFDEV